jgi:hypothetical protein
VLAASTVVLMVLALVFNAGGSAPELFGKNVYVVKTDAFGEIKNGSAVFTSRTAPAELVDGNLVVFENADKVAGLAEITSTELRDGVYSFTAVSERGTEIFLTGSQIIGRAVQYSQFMGALVTFAKSSAGVLCIAILPCTAILVGEVGAALRRAGKKGNVNPVNKQDEIPTFIPRPQQTTSVAQAVKHYNANNDSMTAADVLFTSPRTAVPTLTERERKALEAAQRLKQRPVSQARLNEVIDEMKGKSKSSKTAASSEKSAKPTAPAKSAVPDRTGVPDLSALKDEMDRPATAAIGENRDQAGEANSAPPQRRRARPAEPVRPAARPVIDRESLAAQILQQASEVDDGFLGDMGGEAENTARQPIPERMETRPRIPLDADPHAENAARPSQNPNRPASSAYNARTAALGGYGAAARPAINRPQSQRSPDSDNMNDDLSSRSPARQNVNNTQNIRSQGAQTLNVVPNPRTPGAPRISPPPVDARPALNRPPVPGNVVNRAVRLRPALPVRRPAPRPASAGDATASLNLLQDDEDPGYNLGNILNGIDDRQ